MHSTAVRVSCTVIPKARQLKRGDAKSGQSEKNDLSGIWYYADYKGRAGPLTLEQLRKILPKFPEPASVLVWRDGFADWARAGDVPELKEQTSQPPPPPSDNMPTWRVKWWWYPGPVHFDWHWQPSWSEGDDLELNAAEEGQASATQCEPVAPYYGALNAVRV